MAKCSTCTLGEHMLFVPDPSIQDWSIEIIQCPFGDKALHLASKRCCKLLERKAAESLERGDVNEKETCEID